MKRIFIILVCSLLVPFVAIGREKPLWTKGYFVERPNSYVEVVSAVDYTENDARNKAIQQIIERRSLATGHSATIDISNGNITISGNDMLTVKARIIDEYAEQDKSGQYKLYLLVQTAKNPAYEYESVTVTSKYKFSPRVFIPGAAQFHKGQKTRGALFITGEFVLVGGAVINEIFYKNKETKLLGWNNKYYDDIHISRVADEMKTLKTIRNACAIGAAALYVWNIIDGVASKGKPHIVVGDSSSIKVVPYVDNMSSGVMLSLNF